MKLENVLKIGDIDQSDISLKTRTFLKDFGSVAYRDNIDFIHEHMYSLSDTFDDFEKLANLAERSIIDELREIQKVLDENDCAYLRIINLS